MRGFTRFAASAAGPVVVVFVVVAALVLLAASPAAALPVTYTEAVGGDLPQAGTPLPTLTLDAGVNTVSGTVTFSGTAPDFDSFAFIVPAGMQVTQGSVVTADVVGDVTGLLWALNVGSADANGGTLVESVFPDVPGIDGINPLGPQTYNLTHGSTFASFQPSSASYTFSFTVVPEPASLATLAATAILLLRRHRARQRPVHGSRI